MRRPDVARRGPGRELAVAGLGLASALGTDAVAACAAARAGVVRPQPLVGRVVSGPEPGPPEPVVGHPVSFLTHGFAGAARLARLGALALGDLLARFDGRPAELADMPVLLAFGSGYYFDAADLLDNEEPFAAAPPPESDDTAIYKHAVARAVPRMFAQAGLPLPRQIEVFAEDQAGFALALQRAATLMEDPRLKRCLVGGIDSYCDPDLLEALTELGLLASAANPVGLAPGEGAAFLLVERIDSRTTGPRIAAPAYLADGAHQFAPDSPSCLRLARAIEQALDSAGLACGLSIGTHSGGHASAAEWGRALAALPRWAGQGRHLLPAISFGETGAAASALGACLAVRALARGHAGGNAALVWASSPGGRKAAFVVSQP